MYAVFINRDTVNAYTNSLMWYKRRLIRGKGNRLQHSMYKYFYHIFLRCAKRFEVEERYGEMISNKSRFVVFLGLIIATGLSL